MSWSSKVAAVSAPVTAKFVSARKRTTKGKVCTSIAAALSGLPSRTLPTTKATGSITPEVLTP